MAQHQVSRARWYIAGALAMVACILWYGSRGSAPFEAARYPGPFETICRNIYLGVPLMMLGAALYVSRRRAAYFFVGVGATILYTISASVLTLAYARNDLYYSRSIIVYALMAAQYASAPLLWATILLLAAHRFRGRLDLLRFSAMGLLVLVPIVGFTASLVPLSWYGFYSQLQTLFWCIMPAMLIVAVWCMAFRQVARDRTPGDSGRRVALTCPRCGKGVEVPVGHGECPTCRLQIDISLEEGACANCGYRLRGLMGERCPECGAPLAEANEQAGRAR